MTSKELIAAAKSWKSVDQETAWQDVDMLANYILATVREDDDEAITEWWLLQNNFYDSQQYGNDAGIFSLDLTDSDDTLCWNFATNKAEIWIGSRYITIPLKTRGQIRNLLKALGVEVDNAKT